MRELSDGPDVRGKAVMRGELNPQPSMFSYIDLESRIPPSHPLRLVRRIVDQALEAMDAQLDGMYSPEGRPSIPPEQLIRALLLQILFTIRSERQLMERLDYDLSFRFYRGGVQHHKNESVNRVIKTTLAKKPAPIASGHTMTVIACLKQFFAPHCPEHPIGNLPGSLNKGLQIV